MPVTQQPASSLADTVKHDLQTPSATSPSTLNVLRALLGCDPASAANTLVSDLKVNQNSQTITKTPGRVQARKPPAAKPKAKPDFKIHDGASQPIPALPIEKRRALATETFNIALKQLSVRAKEKQHVLQVGPVPTPRKSPVQALQVGSPNRQPPAAPKGKMRVKAQANIPPSDHDTTLRVTADCAIAALKCLDILAQDTSSSSADAGDALIRGAQILLDKLISLGLSAQAEKQVWQVRKQLCTRLGNLERIDHAKCTLSRAMIFETSSADDKTISIISTFQLQIIKVGHLIGPNFVDQTLLQSIEADTPSSSSPVAICVKAIEIGAMTEDKAGQHLYAMAAVLSKLRFGVKGKQNSSLGALEKFKFATAVLKVQCCSWRMLGHRADVEKELWTPMRRALQDYTEACQTGNATDLEVVRKSISALQNLLADLSLEKSLPPSIANLLVEVAQRAGSSEAALAFLREQLYSGEKSNGMAVVINHCRAATIVLGDIASDPTARSALCEVALKHLKTSLKGTASELRDLMLHTARLRKAAVPTILAIEKLAQSDSVEKFDGSLQICLIKLLYAIARFVLRYVSQMGVPSKGTESGQDVLQMQSTLCQSAKNTYDSVLSIMKCRQVRSTALWNETVAALTDHLELANLNDEGSASGSDKATEKRTQPSPQLRISNIYWAWYLEDKAAQLDVSHQALLLERAVEALALCSPYERRVAFAVIKYERLASCYQTLHEDGKARDALFRAIKASISQGVLDEAVEIALTKPARFAWADPNLGAHILGSCLRKLGRICAQVGVQSPQEQTAFYDDENLPQLHRAQLLELQLFAIAELPATPASSANCKVLGRQILKLCEQPQYQVYRIRFIRDVLNHAAKSSDFPVHDFLDDELLQIACTFENTASKSPSVLASYGPLLCLSVLLQWTFLTTRPSAESLQRLIDSTAALLSQCQVAADLDAAVDDSDSLLRQLSAAADYAGMLDLVDLRLTALRAVRQILVLKPDSNPRRLTNCLNDIGRAQVRLGSTFEAGRSFAEAEKLANTAGDDPALLLNCYLGYAEYLVSLEAHAKIAHTLGKAQLTYLQITGLDSQPDRGSGKLKQELYLSHAAFIVSNLAFQLGDLRSAIKYARQCVKLTSGMWSALEKLFDGMKDRVGMTGFDVTHNSIDDAANTTFSLDHSNLRNVVKGAAFWAHINLHFQALLHLSKLCAHCGVYPDALYYAELASKMSLLLTSEPRQIACRVRLVSLHAKGGKNTEAKSLLRGMLQPNLFRNSPNLEAGGFCLDLANAALCVNDLSKSDQYLEKAKYSWAQVASLLDPSDEITKPRSPAPVTYKRKILQETQPKYPRGSKSRAADTKQNAASGSRKAKMAPKISVPPSTSGTSTKTKPTCPAVAKLQEAQNTLSLQIQLRKGSTSSQVCKPEGQTLLVPSTSNEWKLAQATALLDQALVMFGSDAVHCVLAETALAYPSKYSARRPSGRVSALSATTVSAKKITAVKSNQKHQRGDTDVAFDEQSPEGLLHKAYDLLASACSVDTNQSSSDVVHDAQKLFCRLSMLANAIGLPLSYSPSKVFNDSQKPKDAMLLRESFLFDPLGHDNTELRKWPALSKSPALIQSKDTVTQVQLATAAFSDLPDTWSIASISLNDAKTEMLLSRTTAGSTPLILRIPLARSAIDDTETNEFTFTEAREELADIIENANLTAHDSRSQAEKTARKAWWAERENLDHRLKTLLLNMENIWLGGFRGILSQQRKSDEEPLSRFSSSLDTALEKQLPSRQKTGGTSTKRVRLHAHVLDLFISLGHPDENELDDAITDLLYFVVDILQFEGERNAYDEIDFDAILIDVLDALRSYHDACSPDTTARHTILILDKELHAFPWESMPCLLGKSISRMPSMSMIRDRLARIRSQSSDADAYTIPASSGSYILNPSADLASTETTFASIFASQLSTFISITSRKPSEAEFESLLHDKPLLLYFGHGSGAQYIRGRRIKALSACAVTFLMGCSSGKMTECGAFESHGMPWNYMHAGSMAVVGTLWDVTDRDIDRFALAAFEEWGLLENVQEDEAARKKTEARRRKVRNIGDSGGGRKEKKKSSATGRKGKGQVALNEAVNRAKDACILRYLNGAAVVMYGLPVMLE